MNIVHRPGGSGIRTDRPPATHLPGGQRSDRSHATTSDHSHGPRRAVPGDGKPQAKAGVSSFIADLVKLGAEAPGTFHDECLAEEVNPPTADDSTELSRASWDGNAVTVKVLMRYTGRGAVLVKDVGGHTPLHRAAFKGNWDAATEILERARADNVLRELLLEKNDSGHTVRAQRK